LTFVGGEPGVLEDVGLGAARLAAVVAVLRAQAGLQVDQVVDLDRVAEVLAAQAAGGGDDGHQLEVGSLQDGERVGLGGRRAREDLVGDLVELRAHAAPWVGPARRPVVAPAAVATTEAT
jgi:hypothetical protein